jgi:hypothetical protein
MAMAPVSSPWNEAVEKVIDVPVDKAWAIAGDFLGFPSQHIDTVENVKGENGLPGCQRKFLYKNQKGGQNFVVEELTAIDAANHKVAYTLVSTDEIVEPGQEAYIQVTAPSFLSPISARVQIQSLFSGKNIAASSVISTSDLRSLQFHALAEGLSGCGLRVSFLRH